MFNLSVHDVTVNNIYLPGDLRLERRFGFNISNNTVNNVQPIPPPVFVIFNFCYSR